MTTGAFFWILSWIFLFFQQNVFFLAVFLCQYHFGMDGFSFFFAPKHLPPVFPVYPIPDKIYDASDCDFLYFVRADMRDGRGIYLQRLVSCNCGCVPNCAQIWNENDACDHLLG